MKRRQIVKWLMLIAVVLVATMAWGDVPRPIVSYHALSRSAWEAKIEEKSQQERAEKIQELFEKTGIWEIKRKLDPNGIFGELIVFLSPLVFGSIVVICLLRYIRFRGRKYVIAMALAAGPLSMSIFLFWLHWFVPELGIAVAGRMGDDFQSKSYNHDRYIDITVDPKLGETYEQYLERVRECGKDPEGKCVRCGKTTSHMVYNSGRYFMCYDCVLRCKECPKCGRETLARRSKFDPDWHCENCGYVGDGSMMK